MIGSWLRTLALTTLTGAVYVASGPTGQWLAAVVGVTCRARGLRLDCVLPSDGALNPTTYAISAVAFAAAWAASTVFLRHRPVQAFVGLFGALGLAAVAYDLLVGRPLVTGQRLINDTFDVLRFLIFASFALLLLIARRWVMSSSAVGLAAATSFLAATASMIAFQLIRPGLIGAFELYVLYIAYAFGGFTLHLMTLSRLVAGARPLGPRTDLQDVAWSEPGQPGLTGRGRHDGRTEEACAHHAVHLGPGGVHRRELTRIAVDVAAAGVDHLAEGHLAQAMSFRGGDKLGARGRAGAEQNG